jgi:hypothetical protein
MCVLCYTFGSALGDAVLFGGPVAFAAVRRVRAGLARRSELAVAAAADPAPLAVERPLRPPLAPAPPPAPAA